MKNYLIITLFSFTSLLIAQNTDQSWKLYDDTQVAVISVTMDQVSYNWMISHPQSDSMHRCSVHFKNAHIDKVIENVGIRIRGNTSRDSKKKSFKLSFNTFVQGREFYDVDKMNINGEHNDPSIIRSKICWDFFQKIGMKSSRAAHAALYINNLYHGLCISVEHIDDEFINKNFSDPSGNLWKCLYPADLTWKGSNPDSYKFYSGSRQAYELTTNEKVNDYTQLARLIRIITQTPDNQFPDSLESIFNVDEFLKYEAMNVILGGWDDYWSLMNNYYLYYEPTEKKFHWIPYDYDNSFGVDWFSIDWSKAPPYSFPKVAQGQRPLIERILSVPKYRNLYSHFLKFIREKIFYLENWESKLFNLKNMISPFVVNDNFRTLDYGFTLSDFHNSYTTSYSNQHVKKGIRQFAVERYNYLSDKINFVTAPPMIYKIDFFPKNPRPNDSIYVYASGFSSNEIDKMTIHFHPGMLTVIYFYDMKFSPLISSSKVDEADRWVGVIPPLGSLGYGRFKIEAKDKIGITTVYPLGDFINIKASSGSASNSLLINEFMADNTNFIKDPAGEYDDWVELYNPTQNSITLTGMYLTDKKNNLTKWQFTQTNLKLDPGKHLLVWCDENHNDNQPGIHTNFKLSKSGEFIGLIANDGVTWLDSLTFGPQTSDISFGRTPDGSSTWKLMSPTPGSANIITSIANEFTLAEFKVSAFPNPFNPTTTIQYHLNKISDVSITIYDLLGRVIWSIIKTNQPIGINNITWQGKNEIGKSVNSGLYICKISDGNNQSVIKLLLLK